MDEKKTKVKPMTMRRVSDEAVEVEPKVKAKAKKDADSASNTDEIRPVVSASGMFTVVDKEDLEALQAEDTTVPRPRPSKGQVVTTAPNKNAGTVSVSAPKDEEMEEVGFDEWQATQKSDLEDDAAKAQSATDKVRNLIGQTVDAAKVVLEQMRSENKITAFRVVPIGMPMTMDLQPGRVQILTDASKRVIDVQIS